MKRVIVFNKNDLKFMIQVDPVYNDCEIELNAKVVLEKDNIIKEFKLENFMLDVLPMIQDQKLLLLNNGMVLDEDNLLDIQVVLSNLNLFQYALTLSK